MTSVPAEVLTLVERFARHREAYHAHGYNETQLRREFVDPFFKALGWDVDNEHGYAEAYKDVIHEDAIKVGGSTKAPDYSFRIGGIRKFFVETKKPAVNLKKDPEPAYQLRRYAWSAKLPLSILTDFEELSVYNCRVRPNRGDKASKERTLYIRCDEYADRWDEIASIFSRDAILKGSFDKYAESKKKRGTAEVDDAFLKEIETWRERLARNLAMRNPELSQRELNYAVQKTIDRIIFLRICEDRGIEKIDRLRAVTNGPKIYPRLCRLFRDADDKYNSGLFHFHKEKDRPEEPDEWTLALAIDDTVLRDIIRHLYYPDSAYEFSVLPADILGQVYEQFLGKVIRLTKGHRAVVEEKPEVRKAGGVYYTPTYIVDYIVQNTVGKLLEGKTAFDVAGRTQAWRTTKQARPLTVLDPACGSGSFVIGAYQRLLDWYRDWYSANDPERWLKLKQPTIYQAANSLPGEGNGGPNYRLTTSEKKRILLDHIYGVDIDPQAVEVTKLSLLLKVLEGENQETLQRQLRFLHERALPDLASNIKCGNSLIGPDFYAGRQLSLLDDEDRYRINAFDWQAEFPDIFKGKDGGFNAVIGNPPYIRIQTMQEWAPQEVEEFKKRYHAASKGNYDIYVVFVEKGLSLLNKNGRLGFILPHKFFNARYGEPLRELIANAKHLSHVVHFGHQQVFAGATTYTCLMFLDKTGSTECPVEKVNDLDAWRTNSHVDTHVVPLSNISSNQWNFAIGKGVPLFERLETLGTLGDVAHIFQGLVTGADKVFIVHDLEPTNENRLRIRDKDGAEWDLETQMVKPLINDLTLSSYAYPKRTAGIIFPYSLEGASARLFSVKELEALYPRCWQYLDFYREVLRSREKGKWKHKGWYAFGRTQNLTQMEGPKLVVQVISLEGRYAYDSTGLYFTGGGNGPYYGLRWKSDAQILSLHYLQGLLNSALVDWYHHQISSPFRGGYWSYGKRFIEQLPIRMLDLSNPAEKAQHGRMVSLVEDMLALHRQLAAGKLPDDKRRLQAQIDATERQIDRLVYELYGLSEKEVKIVEGANPEQSFAVIC